jgi:DNA invertase Pin-like site-specific DNA recombinase
MMIYIGLLVVIDIEVYFENWGCHYLQLAPFLILYKQYTRKGILYMLVGYSRISPHEKDSHNQLDALIKVGVDMRNIYQDKIEGTHNKRIGLEKMLEELQQGDIVVITELTKLGSSTKELLEITEKIGRRRANVISLKEDWFNTTTANGAIMFDIIEGIVRFEKDLLSERTKEGLAFAKEKGKVGGRPKKTSRDINKAVKLYESKEHTVKEIEEITGVSKATLYRYLKQV